MIMINENLINTYRFADYLKCEMNKAIGEVERAIDMLRLCTNPMPIDIHFNDIPDVIGRMSPIPGSEHIFEELKKNVLQKREIALSVSRKIRKLEDLYNGKEIFEEDDVQTYVIKGETPEVSTNTEEVDPGFRTSWKNSESPEFDYVDFNPEDIPEDETPEDESNATEPETPTPTTVESKPSKSEESKTRIVIPEGWFGIHIPNWRPGQFMVSPNGMVVDLCRVKPVHHYFKSSRGVEVYCFYDNYCRQRVFEIPMTQVMALTVLDDNVVTTVVEKPTLPTSIIGRPTSPVVEPASAPKTTPEPDEVEAEAEAVDTTDAVVINWVEGVDKNRYYMFRDGRLYDKTKAKWCNEYRVATGNQYRLCRKSEKVKDVRIVTLLYKAFHPEARSIKHLMVKNSNKNGELHIDNLTL